MQNGVFHSESGEKLQQRLNEPETLDKLDRLLDRLDILEQSLDSVQVAIQQGPGMAALLTDTVDEIFRNAGNSGIYLEARVQNLLSLLEVVSRPEVSKVLTQITSKIGPMEHFADFLEQGPQLFALFMDSFDEFYSRAKEAGVDLESFFFKLAQGFQKTAILSESKEFDELLTSDALSPELFKGIQMLGQAFSKSQGMPERKVGLFGVLGAMGDSEVQRGVGYLFDVAKQLGRALNQNGQASSSHSLSK